jgi:D-mannonate dehydratase
MHHLIKNGQKSEKLVKFLEEVVEVADRLAIRISLPALRVFICA